MNSSVNTPNPLYVAHDPPSVCAVDFRYSQTEGFVNLLQQLNISILVSTYQANKLIVVRAADHGLSTLVRTFDRPMGMAVQGSIFALGTRREVWFLRNERNLASQIDPVGAHDACFVPRNSHVTGDIGIHEIAWSHGELWVVNTRFSCLCTLNPDFSFVPRWKPRFVSDLVPEDRCHLNGVAIVNERPAYVTALGTTDLRDGWRTTKGHGGCVVDIVHNQVICSGLSMPHSPRYHEGRLWILESGTGSLLRLDPESERPQTITHLPGFARGLAIKGSWAFIGLSKIRPTSVMDGVPLAASRESLKCGIGVVDLRTGKLVELLQFESAVEEIFDLQLLHGVRFPEVLGFQKETINHTFVVPDGSSKPRESSEFCPETLLRK